MQTKTLRDSLVRYRAGLVQLGDLTTYDAAKQRFMNAGVRVAPINLFDPILVAISSF